MATLTAQANYDNFMLLAEDIYAMGGQYVITGLDTTVYALANYPHWQVLTLSTYYAANTYSLARVSSSFTVRITRPLVLMDTKTLNTYANGVFSDNVRYPLYDHISDVFIKPEDGIETSKRFGIEPNTVIKNEDCTD